MFTETSSPRIANGLSRRDRLQREVNRLMHEGRGDAYRILARLGRQLECALALDAVLSTTAHTFRDALKRPYIAVALPEGNGVAVSAVAGTPLRGPLSLPLMHQGEALDDGPD